MPVNEYDELVDIAESLAERLIREGIERGSFDNLPGAGKPINDLDGFREPGWWAKRLVEEERRRAQADD